MRINSCTYVEGIKKAILYFNINNYFLLQEINLLFVKLESISNKVAFIVPEINIKVIHKIMIEFTLN